MVTLAPVLLVSVPVTVKRVGAALQVLIVGRNRAAVGQVAGNGERTGLLQVHGSGVVEGARRGEAAPAATVNVPAAGVGVEAAEQVVAAQIEELRAGSGQCQTRGVGGQAAAAGAELQRAGDKVRLRRSAWYSVKLVRLPADFECVARCQRSGVPLLVKLPPGPLVVKVP
jgi:hypothetical protein